MIQSAVHPNSFIKPCHMLLGSSVYFEIIFHSMRQVFVWTQTWLLLTWKKDNPFLLPPPSISRPYCFFGIEKTNQKTPNVKISLDFCPPINKPNSLPLYLG